MLLRPLLYLFPLLISDQYAYTILPILIETGFCVIHVFVVVLS